MTLKEEVKSLKQLVRDYDKDRLKAWAKIGSLEDKIKCMEVDFEIMSKLAGKYNQR